MPRCSVFSISKDHDPCCDIHGEITKPGRQKTGFDNNKKEVGFLASAHGGNLFCDSRTGDMLATTWLVLDLEARCIPQDLCAEEGTLGLLDDLLVHRRGRVVHDDGTGLVVDLGIDSGVADQVDDPLLALIFAQTETSGEIPIIRLDIWTLGAIAPQLT
jgi:hypothetical protein